MRKNKDLFSIFPADAGVNLAAPIKRCSMTYIPRGCGGEPVSADTLIPVPAYSPRMRG